MKDKQCARAIYWRAKPGQFEAYSDYVRTQVEPIDHEAQLRGALISHTTLLDRTANAPWTHMRLFIFHDAKQRDNMAQALSEAAAALMPNAARRAERSAHAATLRDRVGDADFDLLG
ncbi:MAG: hypothetical protein ABI343_11995 [Burkholderiaceae bacterium]